MEPNATLWTTEVILQLGQHHLVGTHPMVKFMIESIFTPTLVISFRGGSSLWFLPGPLTYTQQDSVTQLMKVINASYWAINLSDSSLASDCWICMKPGPIQHIGVIFN
jgi:hypothetical protein